jgi:acetyl esterase
MIWFFDNYAPGEERFRPEVSPLRAEDLSDLPSAYVLSSEYDVLRDEAEAYAAKMRLAGVDVTTKRFDGMSHGFLRMHKLFDVADVALNDISEAIRSAVAKRE